VRHASKVVFVLGQESAMVVYLAIQITVSILNAYLVLKTVNADIQVNVIFAKLVMRKTSMKNAPYVLKVMECQKVVNALAVLQIVSASLLANAQNV
jgi:hypothetical protein